MKDLSTNGKRLFIARHGETIFNKAARIQGNEAYTPLTLTGFAQADDLGLALAHHLGEEPALDLVASDTDRALQTLSIITEHIGLDWHQARPDIRLGEIEMGAWTGTYYADLDGALEIDTDDMLFATIAPGGESYRDIVARLQQWLGDQKFERDTVLISHGMTSRVLRGMLTSLPEHPKYDAPIAQSLPQGSIVEICDGVETVIHLGGGEGEKA